MYGPKSCSGNAVAGRQAAELLSRGQLTSVLQAKLSALKGGYLKSSGNSGAAKRSAAHEDATWFTLCPVRRVSTSWGQR